ncbi:MAG: hypothetical protein L0I80_00895 [Brevibacterium sp.]|uniref:hypothetical protein n=1 Tax=Brevibacterium sp. TaxID=1701 RepID=UPI0026489F47|nr:hypothetical protein [Brevibacterium sp.]MDN5806824.1 hypothetical protein [Brevibacterium sp.]MDN5834401.1 hypothetical protein [Brevibacterium sp.]MDN5875562.1 hypothetical protein [Brevibacterium sp.]MDN5909780.1 hypothetical protein [Brevibacterium sp.]MDN6122415.1 hypothetical protein [Brevibacterium sp.]
MKNAFGLIAVSMLILSGCSALPEADAEPGDPEDAQAVSEPKADSSGGFGVYEVIDSAGTMYTLDLSEPLDYSNDLIERSNRVLAEAVDVDVSKIDQVVLWSVLDVDNREGTEQASTRFTDIVIVGEGQQFGATTEISDFYDELADEYINSDTILDEDYDEAVDVFGKWVDQDLNAKPGVRLQLPVIVSDIPESIESVWYDDLEMERK